METTIGLTVRRIADNWFVYEHGVRIAKCIDQTTAQRIAEALIPSACSCCGMEGRKAI